MYLGLFQVNEFPVIEAAMLVVEDVPQLVGNASGFADDFIDRIFMSVQQIWLFRNMEW